MKLIYKQTKEFYKKAKDVCYISKIAFLFYAFACVFYWFVNLINPEILSGISFLFEPIFKIVRSFYVQKTISLEAIDLSPIITSVISIGFTILSHTAKDLVERQEELTKIELEKKQKEADENTQKQIETEYFNEMKKYNNFIMLVDFNVQPIKSLMFDDDVDEDELRGIKISLMSELITSIRGEYIYSKTKYGNDSFYIIGDITKTPECISQIVSTIYELSKKYSNFNITLSHNLSFDAISKNPNIEEKINFLKKIIQLKYNNSILTTSLFKTCYEILSDSAIKFTVLGKFQFLIGESSSNYELYSVKSYKYGF